MSETIRLFVGADGNNCDLESQAVLEYTARKYCSLPLEITWMQQSASGPWSGWQMGRARTPFTHFRWSVPAVCGFQGSAIYMDSDFIIRADLAELWRQYVPDIALVRRSTGKLTTSCILFDCGAAKMSMLTLEALRAMPDAHGAMLRYFRDRNHLLGDFAGDWDCIDLKGYDDLHDPRIKAIHYSRIETQLHLKYAASRLKAEGRTHWYQGPIGAHWRPELQALFDQELAEAIAAGYPPERYRVEAGVPSVRKNFTYSTSKVAS